MPARGRRTTRRDEPASKASLEAEVEAEPNLVRRFLKILGPGFISGAADDDPSGIGTYAVAGASLGYAPLWTALLTYPLMAAVQLVCAKIGLVTGRGLAGVLREHYPRWLLYGAVIPLFAANTINVGADLGAIAAAINMLVPTLPIPLLVLPIALGILALQIWGSYRLIARVFKWLTLALFAYIGSAILARPDWGEVLRATFIPTISLDQAFLLALVAILGTTISPYLFFWQASEEVEEEVAMGRTQLWRRRGASDRELEYAAVDVNVGMGFSVLVMYFIMLASAATLHESGKTETSSRRPMRPRPCARSPATCRRSCSRSASSAVASWRFRSCPRRPRTRCPRHSAGGTASTRTRAAPSSSTRSSSLRRSSASASITWASTRSMRSSSPR
jgi:Mn2+/Fe2+ NRAMP family transporter